MAEEEQYSRRESVSVCGIEKGEGEEEEKIVSEEGRKVGATFERKDISAIHRSGPKQTGKTRQIIA